MRKITVAVFNTQPPHIYHGGVERRIMEVSKRLRDKVHTRVYSGIKADFKKTTVIDGTVLIPCFSTDKFFPFDNWFFNHTLSRTFNKIKADVYEAHTVSGYGFLKTLKKRKISKPFIQTIHGVLADEYLKSSKISPITPRVKLSRFFLLYLSKIEMETAKNATLIVTVSKYSFQKIVQLYHIEKNKIRIAPNGVDTQRFRPEIISENFKGKMGLKNEKCVLFVGNLVPRKGLHLLVDAAKYVVKERRDVKFVIVGEGPLKNNLIRYARTKKVSEHFIFHSNVSDEILPQLYNCSDLVVLPSLQEGQGITLLEAQATAKPVVACNVGGISEIVLHGKTGFLVNPKSGELAEAVLKLLSDENLREKQGYNGRKFICEKFSWENCAQKMLNIYHELVEMKSP